MPSQPNRNHYQTLQIPRNARLTDINRAHNKLVKANQRDDVPPDARRDESIRNAYATLSDEALRDAYDQTLLVRKAKTGGLMIGASIAGTVAVVAAATWHLHRPAENTAKPARTEAQIRIETLRSIGRVQAIGVSGTASPVGLAFAIEPGVMGAPCDGLSPGSQITVDLGDRNAPAHVLDRDDATGFCKLAVQDAASWPLPLGGPSLPREERVFVAVPNEAGALALKETTVKSVGSDAQGPFYVASVDLPRAAQGGPLVDTHGRVVAVGRLAGNEMHYVPIPGKWLEEKVALPREPARNVEPVGEPKAEGQEAALEAAAKGRPSILDKDPKRKEELRKAFRPDPNLPPDL